MCAIFGIGLQNGSKLDSEGTLGYIIKILLRESQMRGHDAAGIAVVSPKKIAVIKNNRPAEDFTRTKEFENGCKKYLDLDNTSQDKTWIVLGHCRQKTKGTPYNNDNNHPIVTDNVVGVHNGVISNDDLLFRHFEKKGVKRRARVDSEIIFRLIQYYISNQNLRPGPAIQKVAKALSGGYACGFVHTHHPYSMWMFRNSCPIEAVHFPDYGVFIFASSKAYIKTAVKAISLGKMTDICFPQNTAMGVNLYLNRVHSFKVEGRKTRSFSTLGG